MVSDYEGTAHVAFMPQTHFAYFNVLARLRDRTDAQQAIERLRASGLPRADAMLLGAVSDAVHTGSGLTTLDEKLVHGVIRDLLGGAGAGGIIGALGGLLVGALPPVHDVAGLSGGVASFGAAAGLGAIVGLIAGGLLGGVTGFDRSQAGSDTYDDQDAESDTLVGVHCQDERDRARVCEILRACGAFAVRAFEADEEPSV